MRAAIFDMDGTLVDVSGIRHFLLDDRRRRDFTAFHSASVDAPPHRWVVEAARAYHARGVAVLVVTARKHKWRHHTAWWLGLNGVPSDGLWMRHDDDDRRDYFVKRDMLARIRDLGYVPVVAFDDNPGVIGLWEAEGIPTVVVPGWLVP